MKKRLLASILSIFMICSSVNLTVFGWGFLEEETVYGDSNEWLSNEQIGVLYRVGVSDWQNIASMKENSDKVVSRGQAAQFIGRFAGLNEVKVDAFETLFKDVTSEHTYYGSIKAVAMAGYMQGDPDGFFRPNDAITTMEAATVLLRCLDYEPIIAMSGINKAFNMTGILEGVPTADEISVSQILRMIYNALKAPAISSNAYELLNDGTVSVDYVIDEDYLGFQHLLGFKSGRGILDGTPETMLKQPQSTLKENRITIDGIEYEYEDNALELLGYLVEYFYRETSDKRRELVYAYKSNRNEEFVLSHDEIIDFSHGVYTYEYKNGTKQISFEGGSRVIFNGVANPNYTEEEMNPGFGTVTLINNDNDSAYDVVKIESYDFYVSTGFVKDVERLYYEDKNGKSDFLDLGKADYFEVWDRGEMIDPSTIMANRLLAVRESSDSTPGFKRYIIESSFAAQSNKQVTSLKKDSVSLEGVVLPVWDKIIDKLEIGKGYDIYTYQGVVVLAVGIDNVGFKNFYLIDYQAQKEAFETKAQIAVIDINRNYQIYDVAEKVIVDGEEYKNLADARGALLNGAELSAGNINKYPVAQPVKIKFTSKGLVKEIDTFYYDRVKEEETSLQTAKIYDADGNAVEATAEKLWFYNRAGSGFYSAGILSGERRELVVGTTGATVIFVSLDERGDIMNYKAPNLIADMEYTVDIVGKNEDTDLAEVIYCYCDDNDEVWKTANAPYIVAELYEELNSDGEVACVVKAYLDATLYTLTCEKELYDELNVGDVYYFNLNVKNQITHNEKQYSPVEGLGNELTKLQNNNALLAYCYGSMVGTVMNLTADGVMRFALIKPEDITKVNGKPDLFGVDVDLFGIDPGRVFKFSKVNGNPKVEIVPMSDIISYNQDPENASLVILNKWTTTVRQVYIIEQ